MSEMSEIPADVRKRWYDVLWPGHTKLSRAWAEKFFSDHSEAFRYYEELKVERPGLCVHPPMHSHEDRSIWVVCVWPAPR